MIDWYDQRVCWKSSFLLKFLPSSLFFPSIILFSQWKIEIFFLKFQEKQQKKNKHQFYFWVVFPNNKKRKKAMCLKKNLIQKWKKRSHLTLCVRVWYYIIILFFSFGQKNKEKSFDSSNNNEKNTLNLSKNFSSSDHYDERKKN